MYEEKEIVEHIKDANEMKQRVRPLYIISDYLVNPDVYEEFQEGIYTLIKGSIEHKECREYPIKFKFYVTDVETHELELRHFVVNLFLWYPLSLLDGIKVIDKSFIMNCPSEINSKGLPNYINNKIILTLREYNLSRRDINKSVSNVMHNLRRISIDFSIILGLTINAEMFMDLFQNNQRFAEIMLTTFDDNEQPSDIEHKLAELMHEEIDILKSQKNNHVGVILRAGTGIKDKQLSECTINGGLKPDLAGNTIPIVMNSNTMIGGLQKVSTLNIDAKAARKSLDKLLATLNYPNCGELLVA